MTDADQLSTQTERQRLDELEETPHARVFDGEPRTVRLELAAGGGVPEHRHSDRTIVCHVLEGTLEMRLGDDEYALEARTDATALLVLAPRNGG